MLMRRTVVSFLFTHDINGAFVNNSETCQDATVEVPEEYVGAVVDMLGKRRGQMLDLSTSGYDKC